MDSLSFLPPSNIPLLEHIVQFYISVDARAQEFRTEILKQLVSMEGKCTTNGYFVKFISIETIGLGELRFPHSACQITFPVHVKGQFINPVKGMVIQSAFIKSNKGDGRGIICTRDPFRIIIPPNLASDTSSQYMDVVCQEFKNELGKPHIIVIGSPWKLYDIPLKMRFIGFYTSDTSPNWSMNLKVGPVPASSPPSLEPDVYAYYKSIKWERGGRYRMNPYELIDAQASYFPDTILPEGYEMPEPPISRAYYKIVEVIKIFNWMMPSPDDIAVCLADAPGGMAQAIAHIFPENRVITTSLREKDAIQYSPLLGKHPKISIDWLHNEDGDLLNQKNITTFSGRLPKKARLVSADGAIDHRPFSADREVIHQQLLYAEILTGLSILDKEGCFFVKLFSRKTDITVKILYWASLFFEEWYLYKPRSSRIASDETLVIYQRFKGFPIPPETIDVLQPLNLHTMAMESLIDIVVPTYVMDKIREFNTFLTRVRNFTIGYSYEMEKHPYDPQRFIGEQKDFAKNFLKIGI